jgi:hypothetical protein
MGNETEKNFQRQQPNPTGTVDDSKKDPTHQGGHNPNQQDPSKKNPAPGEGSRSRDGEEGSEQFEKRRAS